MPVSQLENMLRGEVQKVAASEGGTNGIVELDDIHTPLYEGALEGHSDVTMVRKQLLDICSCLTVFQSKEVGDAIHPAKRDPLAEKAMRKTQALPAAVMDRMTPTMGRFMLKNKVAIVTG